MLPHRKNWVYRLGIDNLKFAASSHFIENCTACHVGGDAATADRDVAHAGMQRIPGGNTCQGCHAEATSLAASSLHVKPTGFETILGGRGYDFTAGTESLARFTKQCTKCHIHNAETPEQPACGHCHVSVPNSAGGGLIAGHRMNGVPDMKNNCTACHGSRIQNEYYGENQALLTRNLAATAVPAEYPFRATAIGADAHKTKGMICKDCHSGAEMHGAGGAVGIDRYGIPGRTQCTTCHAVATLSAAFHTAAHVQTMSCHVCHAQPYKQCFGCHTQEKNGVAYFTNNESDPTRAARRVPPAWSSTVSYAAGAYVTYGGTEYKSLLASNLNHLPDAVGSTWWVAQSAPLPAGDALITFRIGNNPRFGEPGAPKYAVLRHAPIDGDTFKYTIDGTPIEGLVPDLVALPTWKYATPHNVQKATKITTDPDGAGPQTACGNCHSARFSSYWLTDPISDAFGWVPAGATWETTANAEVIQAAPMVPAIE